LPKILYKGSGGGPRVAPLPFHVCPLIGQTAVKHEAELATPTIISLSTIPPRFHLLAPTLQSLLDQTLPAREIVLYIPERYRRFPDWDGTLPEVPAGITIRRCPQDLGPATKVLPATRDYAGQDLDILFCDDDKLYDPGWHARLKRARAAHPGACIVEAGENLPDIADDRRAPDRLPRARRWEKKPLSYRFKRLLTLFTYKSPTYAQSGHVDVLAGHGGVLLRPEWLDAQAWDIPHILWTVDDPWLSGNLERRGIPIWLIAEKRRMPCSGAGEVDALHNLVEMDHDRVLADLAAIDYMRQNHGIWKPAGTPTPPKTWMSDTMRSIAQRSREE
jgi:hypothetical protein